MARERLGEILLRAGLIDEFGLQRALNEQSRWGGQLGRYLVELGLITEETLVRALSTQYKLPAVSIDPQRMNISVAKLVPKDVCEQYGLICFHADPKKKFLDIAMSDPSNIDAIDKVRVATKYNVRPHIAAPTLIDKAINLVFYGDLSLGDELELTSNSGYSSGAKAPEPPRSLALDENSGGSNGWSSSSNAWSSAPGSLPPASQVLEVQVSANKEQEAGNLKSAFSAIKLPPPTYDDGFHITLDVPAVDKAAIHRAKTTVEEQLATLETILNRNSNILQLMLETLMKRGIFSQEEILKILKLQK